MCVCVREFVAERACYTKGLGWKNNNNNNNIANKKKTQEKKNKGLGVSRLNTFMDPERHQSEAALYRKECSF